MNVNVKRGLAVLIIIALIFGWFVTLFGIGGIDSVKDALKYGLDINGGVYVVMEAQTDLQGDELKKLQRWVNSRFAFAAVKKFEDYKP